MVDRRRGRTSCRARGATRDDAVRRASAQAGVARATGDGDAGRREVLLGLADAIRAVVEDRGRERGVGAGVQRRGEVLERARAAGGDHRHADGLGDRARELEVVAVVRPVAVHARQQDLARAALDALARPRDDVDAGGACARRRRRPPSRSRRSALRAFGVDRQHDALRAEHVGRARRSARAARPPPSSPTTLSAPASSTPWASSTERIPPPIVNGMKHSSATRRASSTTVSRLSLVAVMSRKTSSSAPSAS